MAGGLTNAGLSTIAVLLINESSTVAFTSASAYLGVGSASTAFDATHTDLQESTNKSRKAQQSGYPTRSGAALTFRSLWTASSANFRWNEIGVFNKSTAGTMLTRDVVDLGLKPNTQSWQLTYTITLQV